MTDLSGTHVRKRNGKDKFLARKDIDIILFDIQYYNTQNTINVMNS